LLLVVEEVSVMQRLPQSQREALVAQVPCFCLFCVLGICVACWLRADEWIRVRIDLPPRYAGSMSFTRITVRPDQMGGVPCIRGLRIPVATVVGMVADGIDEAEILAAYPDLEAEDVREAMRYAAEAVRERELPLAIPG
jgi:uncharacterized protein (DUF433 family)